MDSLPIIAALLVDTAVPELRGANLRPRAEMVHMADERGDATVGSTLPEPAFGQEKSAFDGDFLIVAAGAVLLPSYEGANETSILPAAAFAGRVGGIGISPRAAGLALDLVPDKPGSRVGIGFGPVLRLRMNRSGRLKDPVIASLGTLRPIIEGGFNLGVTVRRVLNPHDQLSVGTDFRWDISGRGGGGLISPSVSYLTPVSRAQVVGVLASAEFANTRFARYNYEVTPAGSAASGLPVFTPKGGLKSISLRRIHRARSRWQPAQRRAVDRRGGDVHPPQGQRRRNADHRDARKGIAVVRRRGDRLYVLESVT